MGGYGSTRWGWHIPKTTVENCRKLTIYSLKPYLVPGYAGNVRWYRGERETGSIGYQVMGGEKPSAVNLNYTITKRDGDKKELEYSVELQTNPLVWGGVRYWFTCPLMKDYKPCNSRVGCLYLPPSGDYFGCRHCYDLTYRSCQESGQFNNLYASLAVSMQGDYPGINGRDVRKILEDKHTDRLEKFALERFLREWEPLPDQYANYLTAEELCQQSGLSPEELKQLQEIRLLVPDTFDGYYRPKLVGWAKKLGYLIQEGWELGGIKMWAKGRWLADNPKEWPPKREEWKIVK